MTPEERLKEIEKLAKKSSFNGDFDIDHALWLINRVKLLTEALDALYIYGGDMSFKEARELIFKAIHENP